MRTLWSRHGELITTLICAVFVTAGALVAHAGVPAGLAEALFLVGYVAGGYRQAIEGTTKLVRERELDVDLLMVVAAIGAAAIGYWFDGALLIFIFALSGTLEGYASARTQRDIEALMALNPDEVRDIAPNPAFARAWFASRIMRRKDTKDAKQNFQSASPKDLFLWSLRALGLCVA